MKTFMVDILKVLIGTVIGVGIVIFVMSLIIEKLLFWVIPVMIILFIIAIAIGLNLGVKPTLIVIGSFVFGWWGFNPYYKYTCGPNSTDVKVMKPMAQKISEYIIKNGIPESLKDIPELPYELEDCRKETIYGDESYTPRKYFTENSQWKRIDEICHFKNIILNLRFSKDIKPKDAKWNGYLEMDSTRGTGLIMDIDEGENNQFYRGKISLNGKHTGICKSWRQ